MKLIVHAVFQTRGGQHPQSGRAAAEKNVGFNTWIQR
jgi:hypothetical protein